MKTTPLTLLRSYSLTVFFVLMSYPASLFAQTDFFYSATGEKENFKFRKDIVCFKTQPDVKASVWVDEPNFKTIRSLGENTIIVSFDSTRMNLNNFRQNSKIIDAAYALEYADGAIQIPTHEIFIQMKAGRTPEEVLSYVGLKNHVVSIEMFNPYNEIYLVNLNTPLDNILTICRNVYETDWCNFVEPSFIRQIFKHSTRIDGGYCGNTSHYSNPLFQYQWGLKNTEEVEYGVPTDINIENAWCITKGNPNIKIAIVDEGVQLDHPDLEANIRRDLGYDATRNLPAQYPGSFTGDDSHGTACAGIVAAADNNIGIVGVAPNCKIVPIRIGYTVNYREETAKDLPVSDIRENWLTYDSWLARGIAWAWDTAKVDVISCSWGGGGSNNSATNAAIINAVTLGRGSLGCVFVASSGNVDYWPVAWPAKLPYVIAVGGIESLGFPTWASSYLGNNLNVVAPVWEVYTTKLTHLPSPYPGYEIFFWGTSAACPHVAGVAALMLSVNPCLSEEEVKKFMYLGCFKPYPEFGYTFSSEHKYGTWIDRMGYGVVDAYQAVLNALSLPQFFDVPAEVITGIVSKEPLIISDDRVYEVKKYEAKATIHYNKTLAPEVDGIANGFSSTANPFNSTYFMEIENFSGTKATVKTYVYEVLETTSGETSWYPVDTNNVRFHVWVMGGNLHHDLFLQNESVTSTINYNVINNVAAGMNVTSTKPVGNYVIQNKGKVTVQAGESIELSNGFIAENGSFFIAYIEPYFSCDYTASVPAKENGEIIQIISDYSVEKNEMNMQKAQDSYLKLYPNPSASEVTIEYALSRSEEVEITLHDNFGKLMYKLKNRTPHDAGVYKITLNGVELPNGIYFCTLKTENSQKTEKLMIVR